MILNANGRPLVGASYEGQPGYAPINMHVYGRTKPLPLMIADAEALATELLDAAQAAREAADGPYVQVAFIGGSGGRYTYRDPSSMLAVGDLVEVPTRYGTQLARVAALGKGSYTGNILDVTARLAKEPLS